MKNFIQLFEQLEASNKTADKLDALYLYFEQSSPEDKLALIALFTDRKPKKPVNSTLLRAWAAELAGLESWLLEECYTVVGDLAETIALLVGSHSSNTNQTLSLYQLLEEINQMSALSEAERKEKILHYWSVLDKNACFLFNKLLGGSLRVGVSTQLMIQALAKHSLKEPAEISHRLMGRWDLFNTDFETLIFNSQENPDLSRPYPFYLAQPIDQAVAELGDPMHWQAEWKWDGIRVQLIKRNAQVFIWSRGEELLKGRFPELEQAATNLPDGLVLDGELMAWDGNAPLPFALLQTRINRKTLSKKLLQECPCAMLVYDVLEVDGQDIRAKPLHFRRAWLENYFPTLTQKALILPEKLSFQQWEELSELRKQARMYKAEGLMLKHLDSAFRTGRKRGDWWKWKLDPLSLDAVLVYAQKGHGRRADLYTDYTFALWQGEQLLTFTKAYSGLSDEEITEVDRFIKKNTLEKFGPVRTVKAELVFEIGFEGIQASSRHKSGIALRFPRILRWRKDKKAEEANTLEDAKLLLNIS